METYEIHYKYVLKKDPNAFYYRDSVIREGRNKNDHDRVKNAFINEMRNNPDKRLINVISVIYR